MAEEGADMGIVSELPNINVKFISSDKAAGKVAISLDNTIGAFKQAIRDQFDMEPKRLIFLGRILSKEEQTLEECKLKDGMTVVVQVTPKGAAASTPNPAAPTASASASAGPAAGGATATATAGAPAPQAVAQALAGRLGGAATSPAGQAIETIRAQGAGVARESLTTLTKIIDNILAHPMEDKYRKIKRTNAGFRRKVGGVPGGEACMRALGFTEINGPEGSWILNPSASAWNVLNAGRAQIQSALLRLPAAARAPASTGTVGATPGFAGGLGVLPPPGSYGTPGAGAGMGGGGGGFAPPDMATIQRMMQNPAMMQGMMNDPSVQAMMRANPQMASAMQQVMANPGLMSQAMNAMNNNPAMMAHAQRMMQDPAALQRASQMDLDGVVRAGVGATGGMGFPPLGAMAAEAPPVPSPAPSTAASPSAPSPAAAPGGTGGDGGGNAVAGGATNGDGAAEMTEDELLAEALRRSLEDS